MTLNESQWAMVSLHLIVLFWVNEVIQAYFNYVIICGVCTWYFTSNSETQGFFSLGKGL